MPVKPYEQAPRIKVPRFEERGGFYTTAERSELMSRIRSKNTKPELALRKVIWHVGFRYRCHDKRLPGKPDLAFHRLKVAVFVDGDFWHGYDWANKKHRIKSNQGFWIPKIERNMQRDREVDRALERMGWQVVRVWEHELKKEFGAVFYRLVRILGEAAGHLEFYLDKD